MPSPSVIRTKLSAILPLIRQRLMDVLQLRPEAVIETAEDDLPPDPLGDQYLWLRPRDQGPNLPVIDGGGRIDARMNRTIAVTLRTRYAADEGTSNLAWLTDATYGHLDKEHAIYDALLNFQPTDLAGNWLVTQPLKPRGGTNPKKDAKAKEWGQSTVDFEVSYEMDLNQSYL
jgi:hypothetical protein